MIFAATRTCAYWSPEVSEAKAIALVKLGQIYGLEEVILESDYKILIYQLPKGATCLPDLDFVLGDTLATRFLLNPLIGCMSKEIATP